MIETGPISNLVGRGADCFIMKLRQGLNQTKYPAMKLNDVCLHRLAVERAAALRPVIVPNRRNGVPHIS
jgi:hypothetical protein